MNVVAQAAMEPFLEQLKREIVRVHGTHPQAMAMTSAVAMLWPYLTSTPGEQATYAEFGQMLQVSHGWAAATLADLVRQGILVRTVARRGRGGGSGYVCPWLEARRAGRAAALQAPAEPELPDATDVESLRRELAMAHDAVRRGLDEVHRLVGAESVTGKALGQAMADVATHLERARTCLAEES